MLKRFQYLLLLMACLFGNTLLALASDKFVIPALVVAGADTKVKLTWPYSEPPIVLVDGQAVKVENDENGYFFIHRFNAKVRQVTVSVNESSDILPVNPMPAWLSVLPPLLAILFALIFKEVISSLFLGALSGTLIAGYYASGLQGFLGGLFKVTDTLVIDVLMDRDHLSIIVFTLMIGAMVAIIAKNGGMHGLAERVSRFASTRLKGQLSAYLMGIVIFFDDYTNTLIVGNTMRPITDRLKISREKLAYIVDSTAAPVVSIALVTTWIGAQLGYIQSGIALIENFAVSPYSVFINSIQFAYYPIFTLVFMLAVILTGRDFGPMLKAERGAVLSSVENDTIIKMREVEDMEPAKELNKRAFMALIPISVLLIATIAGLWITGSRALGGAGSITEILGASNSYLALLWGSFAALAVAGVLSMAAKALSLMQVAESIVTGFKFMLNAIIILVFAWVLAQITSELRTADFIAQTMLGSAFNPVFLPFLTFLVAGSIAFSTGSSWSTMAILYPIALPLCWKLCVDAGMNPEEIHAIFYNVVSCVLAGAVLGDHCSPISDTTILSSMASGCDHLMHVRTQMPYALTVGIVALVGGTLPAAFGLPWYLLMPFGSALLIFILIKKGKRLDDSPLEE